MEDVDEDHAMTLLRASLLRPLTLEEVHYLEECLFEGPAKMEAWEETTLTINRTQVDMGPEWEEWPPVLRGIPRTTGYRRESVFSFEKEEEGDEVVIKK